MTTFTEEDDETLIVSDLLRYADQHEDFNRKFIDDMYDFLEKNGYITESQFGLLEKIYLEETGESWRSQRFEDD